MSPLDPDPGASHRRDPDVTATALRNVNELASLGDVGVRCPVKLARPEDEKNKQNQEVVFSRETAKEEKEERNGELYWYGKRQQAILIRPIQP